MNKYRIITLCLLFLLGAGVGLGMVIQQTLDTQYIQIKYPADMRIDVKPVFK